MTGLPFAKNLRAALAEKDPEWTQERLAREMNVSNRAVAGWCLGETLPQKRYLALLAETLERDPSWFFADNDKAAAA